MNQTVLFTRMSIGWLAMLGTACQTMQVKDAFVRDFSCPAARVTVAPAPPAPPPPELEDDPERVAIWRTNAAKDASNEYIATGCDMEQRYYCIQICQKEGTMPIVTPVAPLYIPPAPAWQPPPPLPPLAPIR